jgi:betaine-aldehyde dehydrogenase
MIETHTKLFIDGTWAKPATSATIDVISPHTEAVIAKVAEAREADVDRAVAAARAAFDTGPWGRTTAAERSAAMQRLLMALQMRSEQLAQVITAEMGSPITFSNLGQVMAANMILDYFARLAGEYAFEDVRQGMMGPTLVRREPVGVVAAIIPWNVPLFTVMLKLGPALASGCTMVIKPAPETPLDAIILAEALVEAEIPAGVVNILPTGREVGEYLVRHPGIDKVSFTGSTAAGKAIAASCAERLARVDLELGGKSAAVVLDDASPEAVLPSLLPFAMPFSGQICFSLTRVLVPARRHDEWLDAFVGATRAMAVGDPADPATQVGPLSMQRQLERVQGYIARGRDEGARVATGGGRPAGLDRGYYVEPTVFHGVTNDMAIAQDEIFGPVVCVIPYADDADAVRLANDTRYGLNNAVFSAEAGRAAAVAKQLRSGSVSVNGCSIDTRVPFGGFKESGVGRQGGPEGLKAYLEPQTVYLHS